MTATDFVKGLHFLFFELELINTHQFSDNERKSHNKPTQHSMLPCIGDLKVGIE